MSEPVHDPLSRQARAAFTEARRVYQPSEERLLRLQAAVTATAQLPAPRRWPRALPWLAAGLLGALSWYALRDVRPPSRTVLEAPVPVASNVVQAPEQVVPETVSSPPPEVVRTARVPRKPARPAERVAKPAPLEHEDVFGPEYDVLPDSAGSPSDWIVAHDAPQAPAAREALTVRGQPRRNDDSLRLEASLLQRARGALARNDLPTARAALREHSQRHAAGQLLLERRALEVQLACAGNDPRAARAAFAQLLLLKPPASLLTVVQRACRAQLSAP